MIIKFPTALYRPLLPKRPDDPGNITFTISSNDPPRPSATGLPLQLGGSKQPLPPRQTPEDRLVAQGEFIFTVAIGTVVEVNDGKKPYEVGQYLEFGSENTAPTILTQNFPELLDLQHNTNYLDLTAVLTEDEANALVTQARKKFNDAVTKLNELRSDVNFISARIQDNQRQINEVQKIRTSALIVFASDPSIIEKLNLKEEELILQRDALATQLNETIGLADKKYQEIIELKEVVR